MNGGNGSQIHVVTDERCAGYSAAGHPERPSRITASLARLRQQTHTPIVWESPVAVSEETLLRAHTSQHLDYVRNATADFDPDTPCLPGIAEHAWRAVGGAVAAMEGALAGRQTFSLMRPPGHHASRAQAMGFCYLNNVAVAALEALARGIPRVAVFDFDVHHGNGTEAILLCEPRAATFSVHQHPCYPDTGAEDLSPAARNFPVAPLTPRADYRNVLAFALAELGRFRPGLVAVSAGFDAYARDTMAHQSLEAEDYHWLGVQIRNLGLPVFGVLEGGYSSDLPELILAYLTGLCGR